MFDHLIIHGKVYVWFLCWLSISQGLTLDFHNVFMNLTFSCNALGIISSWALDIFMSRFLYLVYSAIKPLFFFGWIIINFYHIFTYQNFFLPYIVRIIEKCGFLIIFGSKWEFVILIIEINCLIVEHYLRGL